jgi:endogenous inhibitor of DNA gyrase (YacG/DUF329 family)
MDFFIRKCPQCGKELQYVTQQGLNNANNKKAKCAYCNRKNRELIEKSKGPFIRKCPLCNKDIKYLKVKDYQDAEKNKVNCKSCASIIRMEDLEARKKISNKISGINNPMYGKSFKDIWKEKYTQQEFELLEKEHSNKSIKGSKKAMKGKSLYSVWLEKDGQEIADKKLKDWKGKIARPGKLNGMYGKPSPKGSGNGWSGYYKGIYFRSILELSYLKYLLDNNIKFESGELNYCKNNFR